MRALILADDDTLKFGLEIPKADVVISCGDIPDQLILQFAQASRCERILAVKGNHDSSGPFASAIYDLHLSEKTLGGLRFGGFNGSWKYKPRGNYLYEQNEVEKFLTDFPAVDIFITHNSPRLIHERDEDVHVGFTAFNTYIERTQPRLVIHGHQHVNQETWLGKTRVLGVFGLKFLELPDAI